MIAKNPFAALTANSWHAPNSLSAVRMHLRFLCLQGKQVLYEEQLQQVEEALKQEETDDLKRLRADLQEVIQLTRHLVEYKQQQELQASEANAAGAPPASAQPVTAPSDQAAAPSGPAPAAVPATPAPGQLSGGRVLVGRTCSAEYEGKRYYASIVEVKRDPKVRSLNPLRSF